MIEHHKTAGSWKAKSRRSGNQLRGILSVNLRENPCAEILKLIDRFVQTKTRQYHVEGDIPSSLAREQEHIYTMWMYNRENRHGELHVWLFPYPDEKRIGYAIHHYEEDLNEWDSNAELPAHC